jgi:hypothetical protein
LSHDIDAAKAEADAALGSIASKSQELVGALRRAIMRTQDNAAAWDYTTAAILTAGRDGIDAYREANSAARSTPAPAYFTRDAFADAKPPSSSEVLDNLTNAFSRATSNITACKSQLAGARAQLEAEYHSFYDDELTPFLKRIADTATVTVRGEFGEVESTASRRAPEVVEEENDDSEDDGMQETARSPFFSGALSFARRRGAR